MNKKGQALILAYTIITVFIIIVSALVSSSLTQKNAVLRNKYLNDAFYLSEGAIEYAIANFTNSIANYIIATNISSYSVNTTFTTFGSANVTIQVDFTSLQQNDTTVTEGATYIKTRNYLINATAIHPQDPSITVTIHQIIARRLIPTFQHAVFYNDDLEVLPGANMNLSGRIHCNQDMYLDAESGKTLTINSTYVHSAGSIYNQRKDTNAQLGGEVSIRVTKSGSAKYENMDNLDCDSANWTTEATDLWGGTVQSAVHGVTKLSVPAVASIQSGGYYNSQADCVITNNQAVVNGVTLVNGINCPADTITTSTTLYNNREGEFIRTTNVDLAKLANLGNEVNATGAAFPNHLPSNGLIYATRDDGGSTEEGIRLVNGQQIERSGGLTIVSDQPVYIQGDYNTVNEKPASIICDSINLLSNSWSDANSQNWSKRTTTTTTYNTAFIAGVDTTSSGHYNGGLENYPRLHENWSGTTLNIKGSFVELWNSQMATGEWAYGSPQYTAPTRNWNYNTMYNNPSNLPPFTPWAVEARRIAWWKD